MKLEELPMREYLMFAVGAYHAKDFEKYKQQFLEIFLQNNPNIQKDNKGQVFN